MLPCFNKHIDIPTGMVFQVSTNVFLKSPVTVPVYSFEVLLVEFLFSLLTHSPKRAYFLLKKG